MQAPILGQKRMGGRFQAAVQLRWSEGNQVRFKVSAGAWFSSSVSDKKVKRAFSAEWFTEQT
jgi:hypothetical protein